MKKDTKSYALLVDSNEEDLEALRQSLEELDFGLVETTSMQMALDAVQDALPAIVLSELRLPDGSGFSLCRRLRQQEENAALPIVLISRWASEADRILAFESGADDFIAKPFFKREVTSRIRAITRRSNGRRGLCVPKTNAETAGIRMDSSNHTLWVYDQELPLTPHEFAIFTALAERAGRVVKRPDLIDMTSQGGSRPGIRSVDTHVKSLRRKLGGQGSIIETVRGVGYRLDERFGLKR